MGDEGMAVSRNNSTAEELNNVAIADGIIQCSHLFILVETLLRSVWDLYSGY